MKPPIRHMIWLEHVGTVQWWFFMGFLTNIGSWPWTWALGGSGSMIAQWPLANEKIEMMIIDQWIKGCPLFRQTQISDGTHNWGFSFFFEKKTWRWTNCLGKTRWHSLHWYAEDGFWKMDKTYDLDETGGLTKLMTRSIYWDRLTLQETRERWGNIPIRMDCSTILYGYLQGQV